jgi:hypothetical protein
MAKLTLHHGAAEQAFTEHPTEIARKALIAAADLEAGPWAEVLRRFASTLPHRGPIATGGRLNGSSTLPHEVTITPASDDARPGVDR